MAEFFNTLNMQWYEIIIRLVLATLLGAIIGYEREMHKRSAGLRTNALVCLGACITMMLSMNAFSSGDPARLAAQVISGIGFLGAGVILIQGTNIKGLTTAATLWVVAIIGLAIGGGYYFVGVVATLIAIIVLILLRRLELGVGKKTSIIVEVLNQDGITNQITELAKKYNILISNYEYNIHKRNNGIVAINIEVETNDNINNFYEDIKTNLKPLHIEKH